MRFRSPQAGSSTWQQTGIAPIDRPPSPDPALISRFSRDLAQLWPEGGVLGVAVSGGPDSVALLLLAAQALPGRVEAATVDHGLRAGSADEARDVAQLCGQLGVPHQTLLVSVKEGNLQARAREARYDALAGWYRARGLGALATAHHADDQAETLMMRLNRESGVAGLAGIRQRSDAGGMVIVRPLLAWRRSALAGVVAGAGIVAAQDPSNHADRFDRVRMRKALANAQWLDAQALAASAAHLADAEAVLDWAAAREWSECVWQEGDGWAYRPQAPRAVRLRIIGRIVAAIGGGAARGGAIARLDDALMRGDPGTLAGTLVRSSGGIWRFRPEDRRQSD